jgi:hypothetical protein
MVRCKACGGDFPDDQFQHDKRGTMTRPPIHKVPSPHYTDGDSTDPVILPPLQALTVKQILSSPDRRRELIRQLRESDMMLSPEVIEELLRYIESSDVDERQS